MKLGQRQKVGAKWLLWALERDEENSGFGSATFQFPTIEKFESAHQCFRLFNIAVVFLSENFSLKLL